MLLAEELPLSQAESQLLDAARAFSRREVAPNAARWERERAYPRATLRAAAALGLTRIQIPSTTGGLDLRFRAKLRIMEEIARDDFAFAFALVNTHNAAARLARDGNDSQRARYLDGLLRGELIGAVALTEPAAGSDFAAINTRAERVAGGWRLNGEKAWLTNGVAVDVVVVYAQTDASAGAKGIAAFVVDARRAGFERGAAGFKLADYFAADADLFYAPGTAFKTALTSITGARIYVAAMCCGMVEEALTLALARVAHYADGTTEIQNERIAAYLERGLPG